MTAYFKDYNAVAKSVVDRIGNRIVMGVPLGIGKPIGVINAFYKLALVHPEIQLTILTGLTLSRPRARYDLERRLMNPIIERVLGDYEDPLYEAARVSQTLPKNIRIIEFYLVPGKFLGNTSVQQDYICTNYSNAVRDLMTFSVNVVAQQVAHSTNDNNAYSLSCNSDLFIEGTAALRHSKLNIAIIAEVNQNLPFMPGDAVVMADAFTDIVDTRQYRSLFALPKPQLSAQDHLIGLYSSVLVKDDGCLQIGIGKLEDAITSALILRQNDNHVYQSIFRELNFQHKFAEIFQSDGSMLPFDKGLYASTEMLSDGYLHLYNAKILKKLVYDHAGLQKLFNAGSITAAVSPDLLEIFVKNKILNPVLTETDIHFLLEFNLIKKDVRYDGGYFILPSGERIAADLTSTVSRTLIVDKCLNPEIGAGRLVHAGFFLGTNDFYQQLRQMPAAELDKIDMTSIARTNRMFWQHELLELQRQNARLINTAMMVTLGGSVISDGLRNWQEVSGVGGQFDFAYMAQKLSGARFIINCHSTRNSRGKVTSNILWDYPNATLARNMRDIVITEYGIADCRAKTDAEMIKQLLNVTDSRFQEGLLRIAKTFGKIPSDYEIPSHFQNNLPSQFESLMKELHVRGFCVPYPFGSDLTQEEQVLQQALLRLKNCSRFQRVITLLKALFFFKPDEKYSACLKRMDLLHPGNFNEYINKNC